MQWRWVWQLYSAHLKVTSCYCQYHVCSSLQFSSLSSVVVHLIVQFSATVSLIKLWYINASQGRIHCVIFTKFAEFVPCFRMRQLLKCRQMCSRAYGVMGVLCWQSLVIPKFSAPPSSETMRQTLKNFRGARMCSRSSITMWRLMGLGFHWPPVRSKTLSFLFVCLFVCPSCFWTSEFVHPISP